VSHAAASAALERALEISRELAADADRGEVRSTASLDAERRQLLQFVRGAMHPLNASALQVLREIAQLNDRAIGHLEHRKRSLERDMDLVAVGRRAVRAYSSTRLHR
jgi:hypothetical protein